MSEHLGPWPWTPAKKAISIGRKNAVAQDCSSQGTGKRLPRDFQSDDLPHGSDIEHERPEAAGICAPVKLRPGSWP